MLPVQVASAEEVSKNTVSVQRDKVVSGKLREMEEDRAWNYLIPGMTVQELIDTSIYRKPPVQHDNILILDPQDYTGWQSFIWGAELGWDGGGWEIPEEDFYREPPNNALAEDVFVYNNELTIKSGSFLKDVYGATDYYNPVFDNTINILGDTVISGNVYGGRARRRLKGNKVNITDGVTIGGDVYGGYTDENHYIKIGVGDGGD